MENHHFLTSESTIDGHFLYSSYVLLPESILRLAIAMLKLKS